MIEALLDDALDDGVDLRPVRRSRPTAAVPHKASLRGIEPGTVWLASADALIMPSVSAALAAADCVVCDAGLSTAAIGLVRGAARYLELVPGSADARERAQRRCLTLAEDGWRVLRVFRSEPVGMADAVLTASLLSQSAVGMRVEGLAAELIGTPEIEPLPAHAGLLPQATMSLAGVAG